MGIARVSELYTGLSYILDTRPPANFVSIPDKSHRLQRA